MGSACFDSGGSACGKRGRELLPAWCGSRHFRVLPERRGKGEQAHQCAHTAPAGLLLHALLHVSGMVWCGESARYRVSYSYLCTKVTTSALFFDFFCVPLYGRPKAVNLTLAATTQHNMCAADAGAFIVLGNHVVSFTSVARISAIVRS